MLSLTILCFFHNNLSITIQEGKLIRIGYWPNRISNGSDRLSSTTSSLVTHTAHVVGAESPLHNPVTESEEVYIACQFFKISKGFHIQPELLSPSITVGEKSLHEPCFSSMWIHKELESIRRGDSTEQQNIHSTYTFKNTPSGYFS